MRPDAQLFLHVLGAMGLFGSVGAVAVLGVAGRGRAGSTALPRAALATTLAVAVPSWALMLGFGSWTKSKEGLPDGISWIGVGMGVASAGIAALVVSAGIAYWWLRRPASSWQPTVLAAVSAGYLVALGVAWWVMTAKVSL